MLNVVLLRHREEIDARHVCSDCDTGRTVVRKVRAERRKACCAMLVEVVTPAGYNFKAIEGPIAA